MAQKSWVGAPRQVSCGCCTGGCVCEFHHDGAGGIRVNVCAYHEKVGHTHVTETQEQANERFVNEVEKL